MYVLTNDQQNNRFTKSYNIYIYIYIYIYIFIYIAPRSYKFQRHYILMRITWSLCQPCMIYHWALLSSLKHRISKNSELASFGEFVTRCRYVRIENRQQGLDSRAVLNPAAKFEQWPNMGATTAATDHLRIIYESVDQRCQMRYPHLALPL